MIEAIANAYELTIYSWGVLALLMLVQMTIADVIGIQAKHTPGTPPKQSHDNALFRASRTVANTNESIGVYLVIALFCIFNGADATYTGYLSWSFVIGRAIYAVCYYTNQTTLRSTVFGITLLALAGLLGVGAFT